MRPMNLIDEAQHLLHAGEEQNVPVRMLGGIAIAMRCPTAKIAPFAREYSDLDAVILSADRSRIDDVAGRLGLEGDRAFNAQRGNERRCYHRADGLTLDVFVEKFSMCHAVPLGARLLTTQQSTLP